MVTVAGRGSHGRPLMKRGPGSPTELAPSALIYHLSSATHNDLLHQRERFPSPRSFRGGQSLLGAPEVYPLHIIGQNWISCPQTSQRGEGQCGCHDGTGTTTTKPWSGHTRTRPQGPFGKDRVRKPEGVCHTQRVLHNLQIFLNLFKRKPLCTF